jgi:hypothetical protein
MSGDDAPLNLINLAFDEVKRSADHRLDPLRRQQIYRAIESSFAEDADYIHGTVACLSARRVLPLFRAEFPEDVVPEEVLSTAEAYLAGRLDQQAALDRLDLGHHASGNAWGYDEGQIAPSAWLAANASYHALAEALGNRPLLSLPEHRRLGQAVAWIDEDLCWLDIADTASVACMAQVSMGDSPIDSGGPMLDFWAWWLTEILATAIKNAAQAKRVGGT